MKVKVTILYKQKATFVVETDGETEHGVSFVNVQRMVSGVPFDKLQERFGAVITTAPSHSEFAVIKF